MIGFLRRILAELCPALELISIFLFFCACLGKRLLESSAPVNIPGSLVRSSSLHSSSSLSTSPLNSLSQSLSQSFVSSTMVPHQQQPQPLKSEQNILGTSASSHNSLGK